VAYNNEKISCLNHLDTIFLLGQDVLLNPLRPTVTNVSFYHFRSCSCSFVFGHDFLKILVEVGKWITYMGKLFLPKTDFQFHSRNLIFCEEWAAFFPLDTREKNFYFQIHAVNFCKTFCACSPSSLGQDLTIKNKIK
jgi:hypothetical protein